MRKGLYEKISFPQQPELSQVQDRVSDVVDKLSTAHDIISSPVVRMVASGAIPVGAAVVVFTGGPGCTMTLPPAASQGTNTATVVMVLNRSTVTVNLKPSAGEAINGGALLACGAGVLHICVSDAVSAWLTT